jgi:hypothetical protein
MYEIINLVKNAFVEHVHHHIQLVGIFFFFFFNKDLSKYCINDPEQEAFTLQSIHKIFAIKCYL